MPREASSSRAPDVVDVVGIAAVDEDVAGRKVREQVDNRGVHDSGRDHQPDDPRRRELVDQIGERRRRDGAVLCELLDRLRRTVEDHALMTGRKKAAGHVGAHAPESNDSKLHSRLLQSADCSVVFIWETCAGGRATLGSHARSEYTRR